MIRWIFILMFPVMLGCEREWHDVRGDIHDHIDLTKEKPVEIMYDMTGRQYLMFSNGCRMLNLPIPEMKEDMRGGFYSDPITNVEGYEMCEDYGWRRIRE